MKVRKAIDYKVKGLGKAIKKARLKDGRPVNELADIAGMTRANWTKIEREETLTLPLATLRRIEGALNVRFFSPDSPLGEEEGETEVPVLSKSISIPKPTS